MASKQTLNAKNLEALGAEKLSEMLMDLSKGNAAAKRRLRLELAGASSVEELAKEVRKRLVTISRSTSFVDWRNRKILIADLETQYVAIVKKIGKEDPAVGLELLWRFIDLAPSVFDRCDDSNGTISEIFRSASDDIGTLAHAAEIDPINLSDRVYDALLSNSFGQFDGLIPAVSSALGKVGLEHLKLRMNQLANKPAKRVALSERRKIGWSTSGAIYAEDIEESSRSWVSSSALKEIADALGDVDGYIKQYTKEQHRVPKIAADIAVRLLKAGRCPEALDFVEKAKSDFEDFIGFELIDAKVSILEALGRKDEAQQVRWACFGKSLSPTHLREFLKKLPDFDDIEAEEKALDLAEEYPSALAAISFFIGWLALERASRLILTRTSEIDGNHYEILTPAASSLGDNFPLAATIALRSMIDFALINARHSRYGHAARHLNDCEELAKRIESFGIFETHEAYCERIQLEHRQKTSFWSEVRGKKSESSSAKSILMNSRLSR